ncbi:uncharacterized protein LOC123699784 [Colias croceus]|uniref:uncharacterized protein LOC123699784 n=1 Tax=Colias crocea TaxID=72248 RepID=UPI001E27CDF2|nr:uncharacterized protein LOC123699784 [Colias croceus]
MEEFNKLSAEFKSNWICTGCNVKQKRSGNNSETPIRSPLSTPTTSNVTLRAKPSSNANLLVSASSPESANISTDALRILIREELKYVLHNYIEEKIGNQLSEIRRDIEEFRTSLSFINQQYEDIKTEYQTKFNTLESLVAANTSLRSSIQDLSSRLNQFDQLSRASNLEIQCVPEFKNENIPNMIAQLARTVQYSLDDNDIHFCARIAKMHKESQRPRSILVKLNSPRTRDNFLRSIIKYNRESKIKLQSRDLGIGSDQSSAIYVMEHLSHENKLLHAEARKKAKQLDYKYVWIRGGKIFMRKAPNSNAVLVKDIHVLKNLNE